MTDLTPALTAEQWQVRLKNFDQPVPTVEHFSDSEDILFRAFPGQLAMRDSEAEWHYRFDGDKLPMLIALANAALPDGHPGKITRADAEAAHAIATNSGSWTDENRDIVERLAAKLFAVLPLPDAPC